MRSPVPRPIDLLELFRTGRFDGLRIGQTGERILLDFPAPDDWSSDAAALESAAIWRYGNIELHFHDDRLCLIFCDHIDTLDGGPSLALDPWILRRSANLKLREVVAALDREHLDFTQTTNVVSDGAYVCVTLTLRSGVALQFDARGDDELGDVRLRVGLDHDELSLGAFSLKTAGI